MTASGGDDVSDDEDLLGALAKAPLFRDLETADRAEVAALFAPFAAPPGEVLVRQGEATRALFLIARGRVEVDARTAQEGNVAVTLLSGGDAFGEFSLFDAEKRSASARALDAVTGYRLDGDTFDAFFATHTPAVAHVLQRINVELAARLRRLTRRGKARGPIPAAVLTDVPVSVAVDPSLWPILHEMTFFADFDDEDRETILSRLRRWDMPAGHVLFEENTPSGGAYLILEGAVEICVQRDGQLHRLTVLETGRLVGEVALIDSKPRSATCLTRERSRLLELPADVYDELTQGGQPIGDRLQAAVARALIRSLRRGNRHQVGR